MENIDNKIILNDDDGNEVEFEFLDLVEYQDEKYVVLIPCDEEDDDGDVVILKLESVNDDDTESYTGVEDEAVLDAVYDIFKERFKDEFDFED